VKVDPQTKTVHRKNCKKKVKRLKRIKGRKNITKKKKNPIKNIQIGLLVLKVMDLIVQVF
jgi:hypothetical protein